MVYAGMNSRYFDMCDPPPDVTLVDLDTPNITVYVDAFLHYKEVYA